MMGFLKNAENFIIKLSPKELQKYLLIYMASVCAAAGLLIYWQYSKTNDLRKKLVAANKQRSEVREILTQDQVVKYQKEIVDRTLKQRKHFKLQDYFENTVQKLRLQNSLKKSTPSVSNLEGLRAQGYSEARVDASLVNLNTKQLVELLDEIEQNTIIYIKNLEINRSGKAPVIDVMLTIATLQRDKDEMAG
jgi:hypothetical protein